MHMIRKGQVRWLSKGDIAAQVRFIKSCSIPLLSYPQASQTNSFSPGYLQHSQINQ
jgi:hypothetical protein